MAITLDGSNGITTDIASNESATFNRDTTDGDLIILQKDNSTVGSIAAYSSDLVIGTGDTGLRFKDGSDEIWPVNTSTGVATNGAVDIGGPTERFKDLYLSGGIYLGGTGSDNYLDDYEEGVWYPNTIAGSATASGYYVKIGRQVIVTCDIYAFTDQGTTSSVTVTGLPFAVTGMEHVGECMHRFISVGNDGMSAYTYSGQTTVLIYANNSGANWTNVHHSHLNSSSGFKFSLAYNTAQ